MNCVIVKAHVESATLTILPRTCGLCPLAVQLDCVQVFCN